MNTWVTGCYNGSKTLTGSNVELYESDFLLLERISLRLCIVSGQRGEVRCCFGRSRKDELMRERNERWCTDTFRDATSTFPVGLAVNTRDDSAIAASRTSMQVDHRLDIPLARA